MVFLPLFQLRKHYFPSLPAGDLRCLQRADNLFAIVKVRRHTAAVCDSINKLFECMYKSMFIPDNMSSITSLMARIIEMVRIIISAGIAAKKAVRESLR